MLINMKGVKKQSQFNKNVKIVKNPIYQKLQKIFYSQEREIQQNVKVDIQKQKENLKLNLDMAISGSKKNDNSINSHIQQQHKAITLSLSTQGESRTFLRTKQNQNLYEDYLADIKLQNHAISKAQKPYISKPTIISNEIIKTKNQNNIENKQIDFTQAFSQLRIQPLKQLKIQAKQNEKSIKKSLIKQSLVISKDNINELQQKLNYYQKMEQFYLQQINQYRQDKKLLQWKLKLIVQELLQNKKESRNYCSENGFNSNKQQCAMLKTKNCFSISKLKKSNILSDLICQKSIYKQQQNQELSQSDSNSQELYSQSPSSNQNLSSNKHKSEQSNQSNSEHFFSQYQMRTVSPSTSGQKNNQKNEISTQSVSNFETNYLIEPINCFMGLDSKIQKECYSYQKDLSYKKIKELISPHQNTNRFKEFKLNLDEIIMVESDEEEENEKNILKDHDTNTQRIQRENRLNQKLSRSTFDSIKFMDQNINIRKQI